MKRIAAVILFMAMAVIAYGSDSLKVFYRIRLDRDIDKAAQRMVVEGLDRAVKSNADYILLDLDTYGGAVDAADSIRSAILRCDTPVLAYVNMQAASAGALISIACDSIYMKTGSSIGAATVVDQSGNVMPDKYQSFMRGMMRSTAQATGRDPKIAESMVDTANVLSLTPEEAIKVGYCEGIYESELEVMEAVADDNEFTVRNMEDDLTWVDRLIDLLLNPILQSIFMMMIIGGIFVEIRTPGIGLPLVTAIVGAVLYFAPGYIGNLVEHWEILLFVVGLILIGIELFVIPGFGVCGISGIVCVVLALAFSMVDNIELYERIGFAAIIGDRRLKSLHAHHRTMHFGLGQITQIVDDVLIGDLFRFFERFALDKFSQNGAGCNSRSTAECFELHIGNAAVFIQFECQFESISASGVADLCLAVRIFHFAHIAGVHEVIHNFVSVVPHYFLFPWVDFAFFKSAAMIAADCSSV